jgi:hypothetical protein
MVIKYEHKPMLFERDDTTADMFGTLPVLWRHFYGTPGRKEAAGTDRCHGIAVGLF